MIPLLRLSLSLSVSVRLNRHLAHIRFWGSLEETFKRLFYGLSIFIFISVLIRFSFFGFDSNYVCK